MIFLDIFLHVQLLVKATQCPLVSGSCAAQFNYQYVAISSMVVVSHLIHKGFLGFFFNLLQLCFAAWRGRTRWPERGSFRRSDWFIQTDAAVSGCRAGSCKGRRTGANGSFGTSASARSGCESRPEPPAGDCCSPRHLETVREVLNCPWDAADAEIRREC